MAKMKTLRAAMYARYSTKRQHETSIEDQFRVCERLAEREHFKIVARYSDAGISGGTARRPGYQSMLADARAGKFQVVLAEDWARLFRETAEQHRATKELLDLGLHIVTAASIDSRQPGFEMLAAVMGAMTELERKQSGYRTRRGQVGIALAGFVAGGKCFGYHHFKKTIGGKTGTVRAIDREQAKTIRRIFQMRADGMSPIAIARVLNEEGVPAPRTGTWRVSALLVILSQPLYDGRSVWGRMKWKRKSSDSSIRIPVAVPESEWITRDVPELRIVERKLFQKVQALQNQDNPLKAAIRRGIRMSPNMGKGGHWLTGLLVCDLCGSNFQLNNGRSYRCPSYHAGKCRNDRLFKRSDAEASMLSILKDELLNPERLRQEQRRIRGLLEDRERSELRAGTNGSALRKIDAKIRSLQKLGLGVAATKAAMAELEREREDLRAVPGKKTSEARRMLARLPDFAKEFEARLATTLMGQDVTKEEMLAIRDATRSLLDGGVIRLRPCKGGVKGKIVLIGFAPHELGLKAPARKARTLSGSGGSICRKYATVMMLPATSRRCADF